MLNAIDIGSIGDKVLGSSGSIVSFNNKGRSKFAIRYPFHDTTYRSGVLCLCPANTSTPIVYYVIISKNADNDPGCRAYALWINCPSKTPGSVSALTTSYDAQSNMCKVVVDTGVNIWGDVSMICQYRTIEGMTVE